MDKLIVIADFNFLESPTEVGILTHENLRGNDTYAFEFSKAWLRDYSGIRLSADLENYSGRQYRKDGSLFSCFSDCLPDRWGRRLIDMKTEIEHGEKAPGKRRLSDWDYIMGVSDLTRMGAFRFASMDGKVINIEDSLAVPPVASIAELIDASKEIEKRVYEHMLPEDKWLHRLWRPGSSAGGARPKAVVKDGNSFYIAKFPSIHDNHDVAKWEHLSHKLAKECGLNVAETKLISSGNGKSVLLSRRFDRDKDKRIQMASSMTLAGLRDGDGESTGCGYLDIVDAILRHSDNVSEDIKELYGRIAFNICVGNTDDHFRNHSFLLNKNGWSLSPAYDLNPTNEYHQSLLINRTSNESSLSLLEDSHEDYLLSKEEARQIILRVCTGLKYWESEAEHLRISPAEIRLFRDRLDFAQSYTYSIGVGRTR